MMFRAGLSAFWPVSASLLSHILINTETPEEILHLVDEIIASIILIVAVFVLFLGSAGVIRRRYRSQKTGVMIEKISFVKHKLRILDRLRRPVARSIQKVSKLLNEFGELTIVDRFNTLLGRALAEMCNKLRLELDVIGDYHVAVTWFVGGALVSLILLLLL